MSEFAKRIDSAVDAWKAKIRGEHSASDAGSDAVASGAPSLERAVRDLEADLANLLEQVALEVGRAEQLELRAMDAIRRGDDRGAREAVVAHQDAVDAMQRLEADATVVRAMIAECRAVLDQPGA